LSGEVAKRTYYHHGDGPLQDTIICMAQNFYGARRFPYLNALG
jgi:DNA gyrase/topoisomerase IV subunit A